MQGNKIGHKIVLDLTTRVDGISNEITSDDIVVTSLLELMSWCG